MIGLQAELTHSVAARSSTRPTRDRCAGRSERGCIISSMSTTEPLGYRRLLLTYLAPQWPRVLALGLLLFAATALALAQPQVLRQFIDHAVAGASFETLAWLAALIIGVALALQVAQVVE